MAKPTKAPWQLTVEERMRQSAEAKNPSLRTEREEYERAIMDAAMMERLNNEANNALKVKALRMGYGGGLQNHSMSGFEQQSAVFWEQDLGAHRLPPSGGVRRPSRRTLGHTSHHNSSSRQPAPVRPSESRACGCAGVSGLDHGPGGRVASGNR